MTEQYPEHSQQYNPLANPGDVYDALQRMRALYESTDELPTEEVDAPAAERPVVDPREALRAIGITAPSESDLAGDGPHRRISLRYGEERLNTQGPQLDRMLDAITDGNDSLQVVAPRDATAHPGLDVVIPPKASERLQEIPAAPTEGPVAAPARHAKEARGRRTLRRRIILGTTALVASAVALFGLTSSQHASEKPSPSPGHSQPSAEPTQPPHGHETPPSIVSITEDAVSGDTITKVQDGSRTTNAVRMGARNQRGPWAMAEEALEASGVADPTNEQIASVDPWMQDNALQQEARTLQAGTTVSYVLGASGLTLTGISR